MIITGLWVPRPLISPSIVYLLFLSDSDHLLVSVSASYWRLLPGSRRSMATATSVALGLEWDPWCSFLPLTPCFQLWFLLGMCWVWSFAYRSFDRVSSRSYFKSKATGQRKSRKAFRCFRSTTFGFEMLASLLSLTLWATAFAVASRSCYLRSTESGFKLRPFCFFLSHDLRWLCFRCTRKCWVCP